MSLFKYPIGISDFEDIRRRNFTYVDKTGFLSDFLGHQSIKVTLFTRPRRFGKSLFQSMLASFFDITKDSRELFAGLKVASNTALCNEWMNKHPVIYISLKDIEAKNFSEALEYIKFTIQDVFKKHEYILSNSNMNNDDKDIFKQLEKGSSNAALLSYSIKFLTRILYKYYNKHVIILIDEYDVPISKSVENNFYEEMISFYRRFLSGPLKDNECLAFAILTGCLRIAKESIFTGLNNVKCCDIDYPVYSDVFGFTHDEVDKLLTDAHCKEMHDAIKEWYDGYNFGQCNNIYCPWSILNYLDDMRAIGCKIEPKAYWVGTSGNEITKGFNGCIPASIQESMIALRDGKSVSTIINNELNYKEIYNQSNNFWSLLYFTGYLTKKYNNKSDFIKNNNLEIVELSIHNKEVNIAFENEIISWFSNIVPKNDLQAEFFRIFWDGDAVKLTKILNEYMLLSASFRDYQYKESFYHALLQGIFMFNYKTLSNREEGIGIYDLAIFDGSNKKAAIIEVKASKSEDDMKKCAKKALSQIAKKKYDVRCRHEGYTEIFHWGMAFYKKSCMMSVRRVKM